MRSQIILFLVVGVMLVLAVTVVVPVVLAVMALFSRVTLELHP